MAKLVVLIIIAGGILRFYNLHSIPSFHSDEVDFAYNALSILHTGYDTTGVKLPIGTTSSGDLRPALYLYLTIASVTVFGLSEFAARFPSALFGVLTIGLLYVFTKEVFNNKFIAACASILFSFSFWHITLSRESSEKIVALFFVMLGIHLLVLFIKREHVYLLLASFVILFLSIHTYYSPRLFLLFFLPFTYILFRKKLSKKSNNWMVAASSIFILVTIYFTFLFRTSTERINQLLIFRNPETIAVLEEQIREDGRDAFPLMTRVFHNKIVNFGYTIARNYSEYFSTNFLFFEGGYPKRVKVPRVGLFNIMELPFLLYGLILLIDAVRKRKDRFSLLLFGWGFLAVVPASLTFDEIPNVYRTLLFLPVINVLTAYGFVRFALQILKKRTTGILVCVAIVGIYVWGIAYYLHQYYVHFGIHTPYWRNYAQKQLATALAQDFRTNKRIYVTKNTGGIEQMLRFYLDYDPVELAREGFPRDHDFSGFGNIIFVPNSCPYYDLISEIRTNFDGTIVFIDAPDCRKRLGIEEKVIAERVVKWQDGEPAYHIVEVGPLVK